PSNWFGREQRSVDEPLFTGQELHEGAHSHEPGDAALESSAELDFLGDSANHVGRDIAAFAVPRGDVDGSVLLDADLGAALGFDLFDHLAAGAYHRADLFRIDLDGEYPGRV